MMTGGQARIVWASVWARKKSWNHTGTGAASATQARRAAAWYSSWSR